MIGALVVAACSGSESGEESTSTLAATTTAATTTTSTVATTTTPAPTTAPTTTMAPTTTASEEQILADVEAAYFAAREAYLAAVQDPTNQDLREVALDLYAGLNRDQLVETLDEFESDGIRAVIDPDNPPIAIVLAGPELQSQDPNLADLVVCEVNSERYIAVAEGVGTSIAIREEAVIGRVLVRFVFDDGRWKSSEGEVLARLESVNECQP